MRCGIGTGRTFTDFVCLRHGERNYRANLLES